MGREELYYDNRRVINDETLSDPDGGDRRYCRCFYMLMDAIPFGTPRTPASGGKSAQFAD